ncbi:PQQ-dependent sugar dehydrogenase [Marinobacter similis]|uniref:PQQ-dependent sugar dehydrogenase n=1 Tax=Marinobacter similis TaxID=1420916 RepID=UPI001F445A4D|nr:PQQ-dependent sugar dehydrogenase [Marinobacter similis]
MTNVVGFKGRVAAFAIALVVGVVLGTVVQTQFNLLALQQLGVEIGAGARWSTTVDDLRQFAPFYAALFGVSFLLSTLVTGLLLRVFGLGHRVLFHAFGAAVALWVTFTLVDALTPPPTLIAATRTLGGVAALLVTAACTGGLYARLTAVKGRPRAGYNSVAALALVIGLGMPAAELRAQPSQDYQVQEVVAGLEHPWSLAFLPDGGAW